MKEFKNFKMFLDSCSWSPDLPCSFTKKSTIQISRWFFCQISASSAWFSALILTLMLYRMPQIREKDGPNPKFEIQVFQDAYNYTHWFFGFPRHIIGSSLAAVFLQKWWKNVPFLNWKLVFEASSSPPAQLLSYHGFNVPENSHLFPFYVPGFFCLKLQQFRWKKHGGFLVA